MPMIDVYLWRIFEYILLTIIEQKRMSQNKSGKSKSNNHILYKIDSFLWMLAYNHSKLFFLLRDYSMNTYNFAQTFKSYYANGYQV